ncbi:hypothetical protein BKA82DRAFT_4145404 [Pisolithus tinctorius]|nr:hypothetical protein BKA82DRAFT_4145404 [Pisolithus tinctorius]
MEFRLFLAEFSIARPPSAPFEDSDVLVLSSRSTLPDSTTVGSVLLYLDLRLSLTITLRSSINQASAGLRYTIPLPESDSSAIARYRWEHIIDSHGSDEPPDEGTIVKRIKEDGSEEEVEIGDEPLPAGSAFAFLISDTSPSASKQFMAVVGEHGMVLSHHRHVSPLRAARIKYAQNHETDEFEWETTYAIGDFSLEKQLERVANEMTSRAREGEALWKRGEIKVVKDREGGELGRWTVWDAGYTR